MESAADQMESAAIDVRRLDCLHFAIGKCERRDTRAPRHVDVLKNEVGSERLDPPNFGSSASASVVMDPLSFAKSRLGLAWEAC